MAIYSITFHREKIYFYIFILDKVNYYGIMYIKNTNIIAIDNNICLSKILIAERGGKNDKVFSTKKAKPKN